MHMMMQLNVLYNFWELETNEKSHEGLKENIAYIPCTLLHGEAMFTLNISSP